MPRYIPQRRPGRKLRLDLETINMVDEAKKKLGREENRTKFVNWVLVNFCRGNYTIHNRLNERD